MTALADNYLKGRCTIEEANLVLSWLMTEAGQNYIISSLGEMPHFLDDPSLFISGENTPSNKMLDVILKNIEPEKV